MSSINHRYFKCYDKKIKNKFDKIKIKNKFNTFTNLINYHKLKKMNKNDIYLFEQYYFDFNININDLFDKYFIKYILKFYTISDYINLF